MILKFKTPQEPGTHLHICRDGANWTLQGVDGAIEQVVFNDRGLGLDKYRVIVQEDGRSAMVIRFADLHRHSDYSLMDGMTTVPEMVKHTEYAGALTDHGNMYGFLEHYKAMKKAGKKPILGFEAYQESLTGELDGAHLILLAKNFRGYQNLLKLTSEAFDHFYRKPHVTWAMLEKYHEGVIATSACLGGIIPHALEDGQDDTAEYALKQLLKIFGEDFYLEIQRHGIRGESLVNQKLIALGAKYGIPVIATTDAHYPTKEDKAAHEIELCAQTKKTMSEPHFTFEGSGYRIRTLMDLEEWTSALDEIGEDDHIWHWEQRQSFLQQPSGEESKVICTDLGNPYHAVTAVRTDRRYQTAWRPVLELARKPDFRQLEIGQKLLCWGWQSLVNGILLENGTYDLVLQRQDGTDISPKDTATFASPAMDDQVIVNKSAVAGLRRKEK